MMLEQGDHSSKRHRVLWIQDLSPVLTQNRFRDFCGGHALGRLGGATRDRGTFCREGF